MKMQEVDINLLRPNSFNSNVVSPENEKKLLESFSRFGCYKPIIVRELDSGTLEIIGGEHRWRTAKELDYRKVPIVNLGKITDQKAKEISLVDNGRFGEDDTLQLAELLKSMGDINDLSTFLPYAEGDIAAIFASGEIDFGDLDIPDDSSSLPEIPAVTAAQTHQVMRFKVPLEDAQWVQKLIEKIMKTQGFTGDDSMTNAGNAFVFLMQEQKR